MDKPTKEQEQWLWEQCGFTAVRRKEVYDIGYYTEYLYQRAFFRFK